MGKYAIYKDHVGQYRWLYISSNGNIIADSGEGYVNKSDCERGIAIMKQSANSPVEDPTYSSYTRSY
jgi:uncharacterized protein YegP (UPF0339 family)